MIHYYESTLVLCAVTTLTISVLLVSAEGGKWNIDTL